MAVTAKVFVYAKAFSGEPKVTDFQLKVEQLPALKDGDVLVKAKFLSVDPYMRMYMANFPVGVTMIGGQVATVVESKHPNFTVGSNVVGQFGWRSHTVFNGNDTSDPTSTPYVLPSFGEHPASLGLGVLGMPGNAAYFGFLEICKPKAGETVVVSGAAGAVGSLVGQIAKAKGCRVVGLAGDDGKCAWLRSLGFDETINYKRCGDLDAALKAAAPDGYDCYFDNVGGALSSAIIAQMRSHGRVSVCGAIASYNDAEVPTEAPLQPLFVGQQLSMQGFVVQRWIGRWMEGIGAMLAMVQSGQVQYQETVTQGFGNVPRAFIGMLRGENTGKAVVAV